MTLPSSSPSPSPGMSTGSFSRASVRFTPPSAPWTYVDSGQLRKPPSTSVRTSRVLPRRKVSSSTSLRMAEASRTAPHSLRAASPCSWTSTDFVQQTALRPFRFVSTTASDIVELVSVRGRSLAVAFGDVERYRQRSAPQLVFQRTLALWVSGENRCGKSEKLDGGLVGVKLFVVQFRSFVHHDRPSDSCRPGCAKSTSLGQIGDGDGESPTSTATFQSGNGNANGHLNGNENRTDPGRAPHGAAISLEAP